MAALSLWDGMFTSAEEARARGNELYRNGAIDDAILCYLEASKLDPNAFAPLANLAAAYYEIGDYGTSNAYADKAISYAVTNAESVPQDSKDRLLVRRVKAHLLSGDVKAARRARDACASITTDDLTTIDRCLEISSTPASKHSRPDPFLLPMLKPVIYPASEYEIIGSDPPSSLFDSSLFNIGEKFLSFLFVDALDLRNVLATISRLADPATKRPSSLGYHLVIVESRTHIVARQLLILSILDQISNTTDPTASALALQTLVYMYVAAIMPPQHAEYLCDRLTAMILSLEEGFSLPFNLQCSKRDLQALMNILRVWRDRGSSCMGTKDARMAACQSSQESGVNSILHLLPARMRKEITLYSDSGILLPSQDGITQDSNNLSSMLTRLSLSLDPSSGDLEAIDATWKPNVTLLGLVDVGASDPELFSSCLDHSPFDFGSRVADKETTDQQGLINIISKWFAKIAKALAAVNDELKLDLVIGDATQIMSSCGRSSAVERNSHTSLPILYDRIHLAAYPDSAGGSLWTYTIAGAALRERSECYLTWKSSAKHGVFQSWKNYDREYLMFAREKASDHRQDILSVFGLRTDKETYPEDDGSTKFENFGVVGYFRARKVGKAQLSFKDLMPRTMLTTWLYRVFLKITLPAPGAKDDTASAIISPLDQNFFFYLLHRLQRRGYPSHWLHDLMQSIANGNLVTDARPPRTKPLKSAELLAKRASSAQDVRFAQLEFLSLGSIWSDYLGFVFVPQVMFLRQDVAARSFEFEWLQELKAPAVYALVIRQEDALLPVDEAGWKNDRRGFSLITTFHWDFVGRTARFWLDDSAIKQFIQENEVIEIWDTESWTCQSETKSISAIKHAEEQAPFELVLGE